MKKRKQAPGFFARLIYAMADIIGGMDSRSKCRYCKLDSCQSSACDNWRPK